MILYKHKHICMQKYIYIDTYVTVYVGMCMWVYIYGKYVLPQQLIIYK